MNKEKLFRLIVAENNKRDKYIESVPLDIRYGIFDNEYVNSILTVNDTLMEAVFGEQSEVVLWFVNEWKPGMKIRHGDVEATIDTIDQYIEWMKKYDGFGE